MTNVDIEALVLSGELFNGTQRSSSPERSPSPDAGWHDDEISAGADQGSDEHAESHGESIGMGPGRTGVKGVIRDHNESERLDRERRERHVRQAQTRMEKSNLGGKTFLEEEREKGLDEKVDELVLMEREAAELRRENVFGQAKERHFGHLREVGIKGFLAAVEKEDKGVWVVVHLYDSSLERCYLVDDTLARLARLHPNTKFLRARASALGFASTKPTRPSRIHRAIRPSRDEDEDSDPYEEEENDGRGEDVDLDMLPTMLVYRDGELVQNWVRVDWEAGPAGIEELLVRHHIITHLHSILGGGTNLGLPGDDEDDDFDLLWSDDDDVDPI